MNRTDNRRGGKSLIAAVLVTAALGVSGAITATAANHEPSQIQASDFDYKAKAHREFTSPADAVSVAATAALLASSYPAGHFQLDLDGHVAGYVR
jgi:hypothetical protein